MNLSERERNKERKRERELLPFEWYTRTLRIFVYFLKPPTHPVPPVQTKKKNPTI